MVHLVYCDNTGKKGEHELDKILNGSKTMVVRGAAGRKIPHSRVFEGEKLYFMEKGTGLINACASVTHVENLMRLSDDEITQTLDRCQDKLKLNDKQRVRWHRKFLCLVEFNDVQAIEPMDIDHQGNMDDWLILKQIEDVVKGSSIPYNYEHSRLK